MATIGNYIVVSLRDSSTGVVIEALGKFQFRQLTSREALTPVRLLIRRSNVILHFQIDVEGESSQLAFLKNGQIARTNRAFSAISGQFLLQDDVERHAAVFIYHGLAVCISFDVQVHVYRTWQSGGKDIVAAPKWVEAEFNAAAFAYLAAKPKFNRTRAYFQLAKFRVSKGNAKNAPRITQLLHDRLISFGLLVARICRADLSEYARVEEFDIDIEQTLEFLRAHPHILIEAAEGPVMLNGKRYTPAEAVPAYERVRRLNLTAPLELLAQCAVFLDGRPELSVARQMLGQPTRQLRALHGGGATSATGREMSLWLSFAPKSMAALALKSQTLSLWQLCGQLATTLDAAAPLARILNSGFRDFDLFEWSVFADVCRALGFASHSAEAFDAVALECGTSIVINSNKDGGSRLVKGLLPGWRDAGAFAGNYRPDIIINYQRRCAIPVDAKFRVASAFTDPCGADSFKEVQAYLNEFGVSGAIIVVPLIPSRLDQAMCGAQRIRGNIRGREYRVWVLEYSPIRPGFPEQLAQALDDIADLEEFSLSA